MPWSVRRSGARKEIDNLASQCDKRIIMIFTLSGAHVGVAKPTSDLRQVGSVGKIEILSHQPEVG